MIVLDREFKILIAEFKILIGEFFGNIYRNDILVLWKIQAKDISSYLQPKELTI